MGYKIIKNFSLSFFILIVLTVLVACTEQKTTKSKPVVVATTSIIADAVRNIGGDFITTETLIAPGIDPHTYKASEGDVIKLSKADLIFYNGLHLEGKLGDVLKRAGNNTKTVAVAKNIPTELLIYENNGEVDPHIWFDPTIWIIAVNEIAKELVELDPDNTIYYNKNQEKYIQQIVLLNKENQELLSTVPEEKRVLLTSHDAFSYFGNLYGWEIIGVQGINTASETSVNTISSLVKTIADKNISCIFTETSVSPKAVQALEEAVKANGGKIKIGEPLYSDSLDAVGTEAGTYVSMYKHNVNSIISGVLDE